MGQMRFSQCVSCKALYEHQAGPGPGPLYCPECKVKIRRIKGKERQRRYQQRRKGR